MIAKRLSGLYLPVKGYLLTWDMGSFAVVCHSNYAVVF